MISLLVPSRGRSQQFKRMIDSACETAYGDIEIVARFDRDDPALGDYPMPEVVVPIVGTRILLSECWNECWGVATGDIFMHAADDIVFHTRGWDLLVRDAINATPDRLWFVYGRDGWQDEKLGTHGFVSREWTNVLGYFVPALFSSDYNDTWLNEVAERAGRRKFLPGVYIEHLHPDAGKAELDRTHLERIERGNLDDVRSVWARTEHLRIESANRITDAVAQAR